MSGESKVTTDHEAIKKWAEERQGKPSRVAGTGDGDAGLLRIDFPDYGNEGKLEEISWDDFFKKFEDEKLAFLYQEEKKDGEQSRFNKLVARE
ncbi:MAG: hypothetical protein ACYC63_06730 [Armatimonadota bacterium]